MSVQHGHLGGNPIAQTLDLVAEVAMIGRVPAGVQWAAVTRRALHFRKERGAFDLPLVTGQEMPRASQSALLLALVLANDVLWTWWHSLDPIERELRCLQRGAPR